MLNAKLSWNNNRHTGSLIIGTFEKQAPEADAASISFSMMTARESYGQRLSFQEFWSWISDKSPSFSLKTCTKAQAQNMAKWLIVKLQKTMWVKNVVKALGDSCQGHPTTVPS